MLISVWSKYISMHQNFCIHAVYCFFKRIWLTQHLRARKARLHVSNKSNRTLEVQHQSLWIYWITTRQQEHGETWRLCAHRRQQDAAISWFVSRFTPRSPFVANLNSIYLTKPLSWDLLWKQPMQRYRWNCQGGLWWTAEFKWRLQWEVNGVERPPCLV